MTSQRRRRKTETAKVLLAKGLELALETGELPTLSATLKACGHTTGAGYQIWPNQRLYWEALAAHITEQAWVDSTGALDGPMVRLVFRQIPTWPDVAANIGHQRRVAAAAAQVTVEELDAAVMAEIVGHLQAKVDQDARISGMGGGATAE